MSKNSTPQLNANSTNLSTTCHAFRVPFLCLGYGKACYYFYSLATDSIKSINLKAKNNCIELLELAPLRWFQEHYPLEGKRGTANICWISAISDLMEQCHKAGKYLGVESLNQALSPIAHKGSREIALNDGGEA